jgi:Vitamin B12 dependent methionine synthase, activation domain
MSWIIRTVGARRQARISETREREPDLRQLRPSAPEFSIAKCRTSMGSNDGSTLMRHRPAPGYPSQPDHTEKATLFELLAAERRIGVKSQGRLPRKMTRDGYQRFSGAPLADANRGSSMPRKFVNRGLETRPVERNADNLLLSIRHGSSFPATITWPVLCAKNSEIQLRSVLSTSATNTTIILIRISSQVCRWRK